MLNAWSNRLIERAEIRDSRTRRRRAQVFGRAQNNSSNNNITNNSNNNNSNSNNQSNATRRCSL